MESTCSRGHRNHYIIMSSCDEYSMPGLLLLVFGLRLVITSSGKTFPTQANP